MAAPVGPKKVHRYTIEFKIQAVRLANHPQIQTQDVAHALDIHPFMLSKWKKDYREGRLKVANEDEVASLPKVLRHPGSDAEKRALKRRVKQLEAKVEARREARTLQRKLAALELEHGHSSPRSDQTKYAQLQHFLPNMAWFLVLENHFRY
ncbi:MAG TPA: transposase [Burkholderiales bacterium]|nr:transposase [Burkholderiales bacterium]